MLASSAVSVALWRGGFACALATLLSSQAPSLETKTAVASFNVQANTAALSIRLQSREASKSPVRKIDQKTSKVVAPEQSVQKTRPNKPSYASDQQKSPKVSHEPIQAANLKTDVSSNEVVEPEASAAINPQPIEKPEASPVATAESQNPILINKPMFAEPPTPPVYPSFARRRGLEGVVLLEIWLDEQGNQTRLKIQSSSGSDSLDNSAIAAVRQWRFKAHDIQGSAYASRVHIPVRFALN